MFNIFSLLDFIFSKEAYSGTATLLSVIAAIIIYRRKQKNEIKAAAAAVWFEMKTAVSNIKIIKSGVDWYRFPYLLSGNSWLKYSNLLYRKIDNDSYESINDFFSLCSRVDNEIKELRNNYSTSLDEKSRILQQKFFSDLTLNENILKEHVANVSKKISVIDLIFVPATPINIMLDNVNNIQNITQTTTGEKIKKLANIK